MITPMEAVKSLPAPGLPPMPSPKFKSQFWRRTHKQGCPPEMPCREPTTNRVERQSLLWLSRGAKKEEPTAQLTAQLPLTAIMRKPKEVPHWYALRVTYGREKRAYDYLVGKHVEAYYPTIKTVKEVDGKRKTVEESRLPNIFFARGTEEEIQSFVYDNINLPYLRFYYKHTHTGARIMKTPLIVPDNQIKSLQIICEKEGSDTLVLQEEVPKFKQGEKVKIIEGDFVGVTGIVARYHGQQRVGLVIDGLLTAVTTYIPTAFLQAID